MKRLRAFTKYEYRDPFWFLIRYLITQRLTKVEELEKSIAQRAAKSLEARNELAKFGILKRVGKGYQLYTQKLEAAKSYLRGRGKQLEEAIGDLRTLDEIKGHLSHEGIRFTEKKLKSGYFRNPLMAEVEAVVRSVCSPKSIGFVINPPAIYPPKIEVPGVGFFTLIKQLDIAIPSAHNPKVLMEVKEYWGEKGGGSKMSNAVYETYCVARELKDLEAGFRKKVYHYVVLDGRNQWQTRRGDLGDFIDFLNQGLISGLFVGKSVAMELREELNRVLSNWPLG